METKKFPLSYVWRLCNTWEPYIEQQHVHNLFDVQSVVDVRDQQDTSVILKEIMRNEQLMINVDDHLFESMEHKACRKPLLQKQLAS